MISADTDSRCETKGKGKMDCVESGEYMLLGQLPLKEKDFEICKMR